jgi:hypothetical protein
MNNTYKIDKINVIFFSMLAIIVFFVWFDIPKSINPILIAPNVIESEYGIGWKSKCNHPPCNSIGFSSHGNVTYTYDYNDRSIDNISIDKRYNIEH